VHYPFFLDLQATDAASPLGEWQHREHTQWTFGGVVDPDDVYNSGASHVVLDRSFDGLFFIPVSTPTTPL
jgi:erythromycin esterase-like protein